MKHDTISLRRRHLMIVGLAGAAAPVMAFAAQSGGALRDAERVSGFSTGAHKLVVSGRILRPDGAPLAGGTVEVWHEDAGAARASALTDADGRFVFTTTAPSGHGGRPQRLDYRVSYQGHEELATQLRFAGVPGATDGRVAQLQRDDAGNWRASFGLTLG